MTAIFLLLLVALGASASAQQVAVQELVSNEVDIVPPASPSGRVTPGGHLLLIEGRTTLVALSANGQVAWRRNLGSSTRITAVDGDRNGQVFALDPRERVLYVFREADGERVRVLRLPDSVVPGRGPYVVAADQSGGVFVLEDTGVVKRISIFEGTSRTVPLKLPSPRRDPRHVLGWLGTSPGGDLFVRAPGATRAVIARAGGQTLVSADLPIGEDLFAIPSTVFASAPLRDGRLVVEIVHGRSGTWEDGLPVQHIARRLYVISDRGYESTGAGALPLKGFGHFLGIGPNDELWFLTTSQLLSPGEKPRLTRAVLR